MTAPSVAWDFPFQRPHLPKPDAWSKYLSEAYDRHWFSNHGPAALTLEERLTARVGRPVVVACNGTAAITAALLALGRSGAVVLPSFTFPATLSAVQQAGFMPILADVSALTWELDVPALERAVALSPAPVAAVVGVRTFGLCRDWHEVELWCRQRDIVLILDSAAALGGRLADGRPVGTQGEMETFSLHATKVFAIGEGGAIAAGEPWTAPLRRAMNFGLETGALLGDGFNGKMCEFAAAVGMAQDVVFDAHLAARRSAAERYREFWQVQAPDWGLAWNPGAPPWQAYPVLAPTADVADAFERDAAARGVQVRRYYRPALHTAAKYDALALGQHLAVSAGLSARMICLPMYSEWKAGELEALLDRLGDVLKK